MEIHKRDVLMMAAQLAGGCLSNPSNAVPAQSQFSDYTRKTMLEACIDDVIQAMGAKGVTIVENDCDCQSCHLRRVRAELK